MTTQTNLTRFETVRETEKAVLLRIGFIYIDHFNEVKLPDGSWMAGKYFDVWVPKSVIKDGEIAEWFINKNMYDQWMKDHCDNGGNRLLSKFF
jgi:hypothetical protein